MHTVRQMVPTQSFCPARWIIHQPTPPCPHQMCLRHNRFNNYACNNNRKLVKMVIAWFPIPSRHMKSARCRWLHWLNISKHSINNCNNVLQMPTVIQVSRNFCFLFLSISLPPPMFRLFKCDDERRLHRFHLRFIYSCGLRGWPMNRTWTCNFGTGRKYQSPNGLDEKYIQLHTCSPRSYLLATWMTY